MRRDGSVRRGADAEERGTQEHIPGTGVGDGKGGGKKKCRCNSQLGTRVTHPNTHRKRLSKA